MATTPRGGGGGARQSSTERVHEQIRTVAKQATDADIAIYESMVARAKTGERGSEVVQITPPVAALIFCDSNVHNRDWSPYKTELFANLMGSGRWRWNGASFVWYKDGVFADGQHRAGAAAISGQMTDTIVAYGLDKNDIATVDAGRPRSAAQAAELHGVQNAKAKASVLQACITYETKRIGGSKPSGMTQIELSEAVIEHDKLLSLALAIAEESKEDIARPVLGEKSHDAAKIAYLMLSAPHPWPEDRVVELLRRLQMGQSVEGEHEPIFQVANILSKEQDKRNEKMPEPTRIGLALHAFQLAERGVKSVQPREFRQVKAKLPRPDLETDEEPIAA